MGGCESVALIKLNEASQGKSQFSVIRPDSNPIQTRQRFRKETKHCHCILKMRTNP